MDESIENVWNMRCGAILVLCAINSLEKYLNVTEAQMKEVWRIERHNLELHTSAGLIDAKMVQVMDCNL